MQENPDGSGLTRLVSELRRRHVVRMALTYGAVGFVLLQAAEIVLPAFLPGFEADAALRVVVVAFLLLCPVVVALAWIYEMTPRGIETMDDLDADAGRPPPARALPRVAFLAFTVMLAGSAGLWWYRTDAAAVEAAVERRAQRQASFVSAASPGADTPIRSLVVLPLDDFSLDPAGTPDPFVAGMHDALVSQLSQLGTVGVISRATAEAYDREGKSLSRIAGDLGVDAVVEGSVLNADGQVRITVQLVSAASDRYVWARDYERALADVITLQREVASAAALEIGALLGGPPAAPVWVPAATTPDPAAGAADTQLVRPALQARTQASAARDATAEVLERRLND